jgi:hypothetical protein
MVNERRFDVSGIKTFDILYFEPDSSVLRFLRFNREFFWPDESPIEELLSISEDNYKMLFFLKEAIIQEIGRPGTSALEASFKALASFIDDIFPAAERMQSEMRQSGQASYEHLWTLFRPMEIVYEKRLIPPYNNPYDQCFRLKRIDDFHSFIDGVSALRLTVEEIIYRHSVTGSSGPRLIRSTRHIRKYDGLKQITAEDLGIVPYGMISSQKQETIRAELSARSRQFLRLCTLPFSVWDYDGPLSLLHSTTGASTKEEMRFSLNERKWQVRFHLALAFRPSS